MYRENINRIYKRKNQNIFITYIQKNLREYVIASIVFIIGILVGIVLINNIDDSQNEEISSYIKASVSNLKDNNTIDKWQILKKSIKQDVIIVTLLWIMGSTVIGLLLVYIIVCFKGFCLGYTISAIIYVLR